MTAPPSLPGTLRQRAFGATRRWILLVAWMVLIFGLSAQPVVPHPGRALGIRDQVVDYTAHAGLFGVLALLAWWAVGDGHTLRRLPRTGRLAPALVLSALYAASDELHQSAVPGRHATLPDLLADLVGIALAGILALVLSRRAARRHTTE